MCRNFIFVCFILCTVLLFNWGRSWRGGTKCDCKIDSLWVRSPLEEMKYLFIYIFISSLWRRGKARRWIPPLNTQCLQNSAESGERSVSTLGSLCLPYCVRDTAWSWFIYYKRRVLPVYSALCLTQWSWLLRWNIWVK